MGGISRLAESGEPLVEKTVCGISLTVPVVVILGKLQVAHQAHFIVAVSHSQKTSLLSGGPFFKRKCRAASRRPEYE